MNKIFYSSLIIPFCIYGCAESEPEDKQPNIILIMSDDQGWGDAGFMGHTELKTPNLDQMADKGIVFNRFYAASPVCSPTRGSVLTGRHPNRYGIVHANRGHIPKEEITLGKALQNHGYMTGHFGKWHLGTMSKIVIEANRGGTAAGRNHYSPPWENGFEVAFSTEAKTPTWDPMLNPPLHILDANRNQKEGDSYGTYYWTGEGSIATENLEGDDSRVIMDRVLPFIQTAVDQNQPFFSIIWFHTPHAPVVAGDKYRKMYEHLPENHQHYYGCLTAMDDQIGRLREKLRSMNVADNTMIWFVSDNGPEGNPVKIDRLQGSAGPLRGRKRSLYEGGVRVPGILEWPDRIENGRITDIAAVTSDFLPTIFEALGIPLPDRPMDGVSLMPLIEGKMGERSMPIAFEFGGYSTLVDNRYKLVHNRSGRRHRSDNGNVPVSEWELYDLLDDLEESENIADQHPEIVEIMKHELGKWQESVKASLDGKDY